MNIFRSEKIEIEYDSYDMWFIMNIYDTYGHYVDTIKVSREDMKALYESLDKIKDVF